MGLVPARCKSECGSISIAQSLLYPRRRLGGAHAAEATPACGVRACYLSIATRRVKCRRFAPP
uniref:Uncharacterized protein n=1 Tax=Ectopseudomonas oleovorans TaxID=301 RepID=A0A653B9U2_ECTOL